MLYIVYYKLTQINKSIDQEISKARYIPLLDL